MAETICYEVTVPDFYRIFFEEMMERHALKIKEVRRYRTANLELILSEK